MRISLDQITATTNIAFAASMAVQRSPNNLLLRLPYFRPTTYAIGVTALGLNIWKFSKSLPNNKYLIKIDNYLREKKDNERDSLIISHAIITILFVTGTFFLARKFNKLALPTKTLTHDLCQLKWDTFSYQEHMQWIATSNAVFSIASTYLKKEWGNIISASASISAISQICIWKGATASIFVSEKYSGTPITQGFSYNYSFQVFKEPSGSYYSLKTDQSKIYLSDIVDDFSKKVRSYMSYPNLLTFTKDSKTHRLTCDFELPKNFLPESLLSCFSSLNIWAKTNRGSIPCDGGKIF